MPAVPMDHSFVYHSYQPLKFMRLLPRTRWGVVYNSTPP
jgi:hypothetical protein